MYFEEICREAAELQQRLHAIPEYSMQEKKTIALLREYLGLGQDGLPYILVKSPGSGEQRRRIAFRAEFDAVCLSGDTPGHYCGHDGHTAVLAAVCKALCAKPHANDLYFIFQPGEETGAGGAICTAALAGEDIDEIYAFHNLPGIEAGTVQLRGGTFACASTGLELRFTGSPAHAAYPEDGANPAAAIAETVLFAEEYIRRPHEGILLSTVIGMTAGGHAYGMSAAEGTLRLTLRAEHQKAFEALCTAVKEKGKSLAARDGLCLQLQEVERFPATENTEACTQRVHRACAALHIPVRDLPEPMRWSEDFGHYLQSMPGAYFGIGAGEAWPELHTGEYVFPAELIPTAVRLWLKLAETEE